MKNGTKAIKLKAKQDKICRVLPMTRAVELPAFKSIIRVPYSKTDLN
jgi:hypothetical protein